MATELEFRNKNPVNEVFGLRLHWGIHPGKLEVRSLSSLVQSVSVDHGSLTQNAVKGLAAWESFGPGRRQNPEPRTHKYPKLYKS